MLRSKLLPTLGKTSHQSWKISQTNKSTHNFFYMRHIVSTIFQTNTVVSNDDHDTKKNRHLNYQIDHKRSKSLCHRSFTCTSLYKTGKCSLPLTYNKKKINFGSPISSSAGKWSNTTCSSAHNISSSSLNSITIQRRTFLGFGRKKKQTDDSSSADATQPDVTEAKTSFDDSTTVFDTAAAANTTAPSLAEVEMAKFEETAAADEIANEVLANTTWSATWWPHDQFIDFLLYLQGVSGYSYAVTIASVTLALRVAMIPIFVSAQKNSSRMAHVKPEMDILKTKLDAADSYDTTVQQQHAKQMRDLFAKYECNPLKAVVVPLVQAPVFMSMFFALRKMPDVVPDELTNGGILWFMDLNAPDPYVVLPVLSAASFWLMMEASKKQMLASNPDQGMMLLTFFRGLAVIMIPMTINFSSAIFCYWTTNNAFSLGQSLMFQNKVVRKQLGIWDPPAPVPGAPPPKGIIKTIQDSLNNRTVKGEKKNAKEKIRMHNATIDAQNAKKVMNLQQMDGRRGRKKVRRMKKK